MGWEPTFSEPWTGHLDVSRPCVRIAFREGGSEDGGHVPGHHTADSATAVNNGYLSPLLSWENYPLQLFLALHLSQEHRLPVCLNR